jgi:hypothetical protein
VVDRPLPPLERATAADASELTELYHTAYRPLADAGLNFTATYQSADYTAEQIAKREI